MSSHIDKEMETLLRTAVEYSPCGLLVIDAQSRIVLVNREVERIFGYTREELSGKPFDILVPVPARDYHATLAEEFFEHPETRAMGMGRDLRGRRKDGTEIPIEIGLNPVRTKCGFYVLSSVVDISARARSEQRFRAAIESAPNGMVMVDRSGTIVLVNREAERLFGYTKEGLLGQSVEILVPERFRSRHSQYRDEFFRNPGRRLMGAGRELYGLRKDGVEIPVEIGLNPIETDEGLLVLSAIVDISSRRRAEEALRAAAEDLKRSNQELEQFAYIASHDLQEPLRMIAGFLKLLEDRYKSSLDEKARSYIEHAVDGATRMSRLISDLLLYSRVERQGKQAEPVDMNTALELALANLRISIHESGANITRDQLPTIQGNPAQLAQLFQNLIGNAIKFRRKGVAPRIHIGCDTRDGLWLISVRDNGIGIAPEYSEKIFMIFQRLHGQKEYPGTGIGLAICKKIVEQLGGSIWVESVPDEGSTFYCTFPKKQQVH